MFVCTVIVVCVFFFVYLLLLMMGLLVLLLVVVLVVVILFCNSCIDSFLRAVITVMTAFNRDISSAPSPDNM